MSVSMRLTRVGGKKDPVWRVVVADRRSPRDGRVIETVGRYNAQTDPSQIVLDRERVRHWLARGAQPSDTVRKLLRAEGLSATGADLPGRAPEAGEVPAIAPAPSPDVAPAATTEAGEGTAPPVPGEPATGGPDTVADAGEAVA